MIRAGEITAKLVPYYRRRLEEIRSEQSTAQGRMQVLNTRFHYARSKYVAPFDLFLDRASGLIYLRVSVGRRMLPVPELAVRIGRYDRTSLWEDVKADFLALIGGTP